MQVRQGLVRSAEAVGPDQPAVSLHAPAIGYVSARYLLAVRRTSQHEPLESQQLRPTRELDFRRSDKASPIEEDCFLWKPREFRGLAHRQPRRDARGCVQRPVDLFGRL